MTPKEIKEQYKEGHTSLARGYVSRRLPEGIAKPYKGKFGEGWKIYTPSWKSTKYCYVTYYTERR